jgi:glutathione S-transferase
VKGRTRTELLRRAGKVQVPYLVDPNTGTALFESEAIRAYLLDTYAR